MPEVRPQAGGQENFLSRTEFEVLFGGAAGPGKTWSLVVDALGLQFRNTPLGKAAIDIPEYVGVLFRRKTTQLVKIIDECKKYYMPSPLNAAFVRQRRGEPGPSFTFPSGAKIFTCHMELEDDKENHQGIEYQYAGFDELSQFTFGQYSYIFSRTRSTIPYLIPRVRSTTNPTGSGLVWVRNRFYKDLIPGKTYYFLPGGATKKDQTRGTLTDEHDEEALTRTFIPGKLDENKILIDNDPAYRQRIKAMGKSYEKALLGGDWYAFSGDFFKHFDSTKSIKHPFIIPEEWKLIGSNDPGFSSPNSFSLKAIDFVGNHYRLGTYYESEKSPTQHAEGIVKFITSFPWTKGRWPDYIVSGKDAFAKKDQYSIQATDKTYADIFLEHGIYLIPASTDRVLGWWAMKDLMERNKFFIFDYMNEQILEQITSVVADDKKEEDIQGRGNDPSVEDHALDEERYSVMSAFSPDESVLNSLLENVGIGRSRSSKPRKNAYVNNL